MTGAKWLAAVAAMALLGGSVSAEAATRTKVAARTKAKQRKPVRRTAAHYRFVPPIVTPGIAPTAVYEAPIAQAPALDYADYRWLDDADAMLDAIGQSPPDFRFDSNGTVRDAWLLRDGSLIVASPLRDEAVPRLYFFAPDMTVPFLVRDGAFSYAFERGTLVALYDRSGRLEPIRGEAAYRQSVLLYGFGRELWFAARTRPPLRSVQNSGFSFSFGYDGRDRWRETDGLRAYRRGAGYDRGRQRAERYRRERDERAARPAPGAGPRADRSQGWSPPAAAWPRADGGGRPGQRRTTGARQSAPGGPPVATSVLTEQPIDRAPATEAEQPARSTRPGRGEGTGGDGAPGERAERRRSPEPPVVSAPPSAPVVRAPQPEPVAVPPQEPQPVAAPPPERAAPTPEPEPAPPSVREPDSRSARRPDEKPE